ncbi:MAG: ABC transporter ATP-binding protein [Clostridia bacterium]|nr:ABC transporter ATP-binding protein [Clostridia bacterium]
MILRIENLSFSYDNTPVLSGVSLEVSEGEAVCLLGPNGSGKTTMLDCVLGFHRHFSGSIEVCGKDVLSLSRPEAAKYISYVPQLHTPTFPYTVREVVLMGRTARSGLLGAPGKEDYEASDRAIRKVGIEDFSARPYTELSGGERKLVLLARAFAQSAPLIVLDEPTVSLDFKNELLFLETLTDLILNEGISVLMATHALQHPLYFESEGLKTKAAMLCRNKPVRTGAPGEIITPENLLEIYGVRAAVTETSDSDGKTVKSVTVFGSEDRF